MQVWASSYKKPMNFSSKWSRYYGTILIFPFLYQLNIYFVSHSAAAYVHDPVYRIPSPGSHLDDIASWEGLLEKMGGQNTAYWPNYPIRLPKGV